MEPNCRSKRMLAIKRCKHFELGGDKKRKVGVVGVGVTLWYNGSILTVCSMSWLLEFSVVVLNCVVWCLGS